MLRNKILRRNDKAKRTKRKRLIMPRSSDDIWGTSQVDKIRRAGLKDAVRVFARNLKRGKKKSEESNEAMTA